MSLNRIAQLTPEQEAQISVYREKWHHIAFSTELLDRQKAENAICATYDLIGLSEPEIQFYRSPYEAGLAIWRLSQRPDRLGDPQENKIRQQLELLYGRLKFSLATPPIEVLETQLEQSFAGLPDNALCQQLLHQFCLELGDGSYRQLYQQLLNEISPEALASQMAFCDFCLSVLEGPGNRETWRLLQSLLTHCGWIYPFAKIAIVCDRPGIYTFDRQHRLHAEGKPAIEYADGFRVYADGGVRLPEKYGKLHPNQWCSQWLLSEKDAQLRQVLVNGIGYGRLCQELQAVEFDRWQDFTLLRINTHVDLETIYLLKQTCPNTGYIDVFRVPPGVESAKEAIAWVQSSIAPKGFTLP